MDLQLKGKTALVTGSTAGIGLAIARRLLQEGAAVTINGRSASRIDEAREQLIREVPGAAVRGFAADFGDQCSVQNLIDQLPAVDILVNNVGIFEPREFASIRDEDWYRLFEVNVMSGVRLARHYLPEMLARNWGRIIFLSSESGIQIPTEMIHYGMTKTAQLAISRGLAQLTAGTAVTVNAVLPGPTRSEGAEQFIRELAAEKGLTEDEMEKEFFQKVRPTSLLQRFASTDEVANLIAYLASPLAVATNGAALRVDGGTVPTII